MLIQLISGGPPLVNGVADFALALARALRRNQQIDSTFLVCNPQWDGPSEIDGFRLTALRTRRPEDLRVALQCAADGAESILLQLSPYGFDASGSPFWLLRGLADFRRAAVPGFRLVTYFHELYATSAPWRRGFWLSPLQRLCAREILRLSDVALTSTDRYAARLARWDRRKASRIAALPVVSGIGEPTEIVPLARRRRRLVVWGSAEARCGIYERHAKTLRAAVHAADIEQMLDIGERCLNAPAAIGETVVQRMGVMAPADLSAVLSNSVLGLMAYNPNYLGKSSLFAAFCAHGVPAFVIPTHPHDQQIWDGIRAGHLFLTPAFASAGAASAAAEMQHVADQSRAWYAAHDSAAHARTLAGILTPVK